MQIKEDNFNSAADAVQKSRKMRFFKKVLKQSTLTRDDPEIRGKVLLNRIAFIDCNKDSQTYTGIFGS